MMAGFAVGMVRFGLEFAYKVPPCGSGRLVTICSLECITLDSRDIQCKFVYSVVYKHII